MGGSIEGRTSVDAILRKRMSGLDGLGDNFGGGDCFLFGSSSYDLDITEKILAMLWNATFQAGPIGVAQCSR